MGAVDLVIQVESPKSVTRGLQRIGRAGHGVGEVSRGRIFPKFRADLLECAVVARRMREGLIETTVVPRNPLDVLAQQVVAIAASAGEEGVAVDELHALFRRTYTYAELERRQLDNVLDMLDGRYPSAEFAELRPRVVWDRVAGTIRARSGARALAVANAGTIPDRGLFSVNLPDGRRVGELDEEMVYEARAGQTFLLGATTLAYRADHARPGGRDAGARRARRGALLARRQRRAAARARRGHRRVRAGGGAAATSRACAREYDLDERAASNLLAFLRDQEAATGVVPSDRTLVAERFRDEIGDWRLCVLSPYGGRVHAAWALALSARIRDAFGLEADAIWSDDGIIVHLPDADEPPGAELVLVEPDEAEDLVVAELGASALFGARFRENAARSLLIPRAYPGRRTPLWQQRLKAQSLLEVARRYPQFPVILETYRECLRDVLDVPGLQDLLRKLSTREISLVEVETQTASPFASSLLFDYVAAYMYEGDTPAAERRAVALSLDRELLRELLGQEELRDLIDPAALEQVEDDLQHRSEHLRARDADALHDVLRRVGDLTAAEAAERTEPPAEAGAWLARLEDERRAVRARLGGEERWFAAEDAGLFRDALGVVPPGGLPDAFLEDVPDAMLRLLRRYARSHGPFETGEVHARYGVDPGPGLAELERAGDLLRGELRPMGTQREWCDPDVLRRVRRASLAVLRKEIEPVGQETLARFAPAWQGVDRFAAAGAGVGPPARRARAAAGSAARAGGLGEGRAAAPARHLLAVLAGRALRQRRGGVGRRRAAGREDAGASRCTSAKTRRCSARRRRPPTRPAASSTSCCGSVSPGAPASTRTSSSSSRDRTPEELREALWDLAWAGEVTNDAFAPLRARGAKASAVPSQSRRAGLRTLSPPHPRDPAAAGPLVARGGHLPRRARRPRGAASCLGRAPARAARCAHARARARRGLPRRLRGAVPGAVGPRDPRRRPPRLLRGGPRRRPVRAAGRRRAPAGARGGSGAGARDRYGRPGAALRSRACAGRTPRCARRAAEPAPIWSPSPAGRCCASTPAAGRCACWAGPTTCSRPSRHSRRRSAAAASAVSSSTPSTASPPWPARSPSASWPWASAAASTTSRWPPAMPEGDTIHHAARRIGAVLDGPRPRRDRDAAPALRTRPLAGAPRRPPAWTPSTPSASTCCCASRADSSSTPICA